MTERESIPFRIAGILIVVLSRISRFITLLQRLHSKFEFMMDNYGVKRRQKCEQFDNGDGNLSRTGSGVSSL